MPRATASSSIDNVNVVRNNKNELIAMNRNGLLIILDEKKRERERYQVVYGAKVNVATTERL